MSFTVQREDIDSLIENLRYGAWPVSKDMDWQASGQDDDGEYFGHGETWEYWEAFSYDLGERTLTLVANGNETRGVVLDEMFFDFDELRDSDDPEFTEDELSELAEVEPYAHGAEGPMMNYWYPFEDYVTLSPEQAAMSLADLPLCVVQVDGAWGLALTGGGMDLSWEVAEAFIRLGYFPPEHVHSLPDMHGYAMTPVRELIGRAMVKRNARLIERLQHDTSYLRERLTRMAEQYGGHFTVAS